MILRLPVVLLFFITQVKIGNYDYNYGSMWYPWWYNMTIIIPAASAAGLLIILAIITPILVKAKRTRRPTSRGDHTEDNDTILLPPVMTEEVENAMKSGRIFLPPVRIETQREKWRKDEQNTRQMDPSQSKLFGDDDEVNMNRARARQPEAKVHDDKRRSTQHRYSSHQRMAPTPGYFGESSHMEHCPRVRYSQHEYASIDHVEDIYLHMSHNGVGLETTYVNWPMPRQSRMPPYIRRQHLTEHQPSEASADLGFHRRRSARKGDTLERAAHVPEQDTYTRNQRLITDNNPVYFPHSRINDNYRFDMAYHHQHHHQQQQHRDRRSQYHHHDDDNMRPTFSRVTRFTDKYKRGQFDYKHM